MSHVWFFNRYNTFCINLETNEERRNRMMQRFETFEMDVSMCRAVTPSDLTDDNFVYFLNPGQRSCAQSHINLWRHIVSQSLPYAMILEDDAMFDRDWVAKLRQFGSGNFDLIMLNGSEPLSECFVWQCVREQFLTGGYIISLEGAKKVLGMFGAEFYASDWMTSRLQVCGNSWCFFPWLVIQEGCESTIGSGVEADHAKVLRCLDAVQYDIANYV